MEGIAVYFKDKDGNEHTLDEILSLDDKTGALVTLTSPEHEAHHGHAFTVSAVDETLANAETINIAFKTPPPLVVMHLWVAATTLVGGSLALIEGPTWDTNTGTATPVVNRLRVENPLQSHILEDKTATPAFTRTNKVLVQVSNIAGGTTLWPRYSWGERGKVEAGAYRAESEFLLKHDTQYVVLFTAIGAANKAQVILNWVEH